MTSETLWQIPKPLSTCEVKPDDDTVLVLRRHGNPAGSRLILSHGNGLAIDLYYPFWSLLADDFDLVIYDLRNHGWNPVGPLHQHHIMSFVNDQEFVLGAVDRLFGEKPKIGVFHSISALASLLSPNGGSQLTARVLFDPPVGPRLDDHSHEFFDVSFKFAAMLTRKRPERFQTRAEFMETFPYRDHFQGALPGVLDLVARTTLRESANGDAYWLRCPRDYEAQIMEYAPILSRMVDFEASHCPTKIIGADPTVPYSFLPTSNLSHILKLDYDFVPETTHFAQLEKPVECVAFMREFLQHHSSIKP